MTDIINDKIEYPIKGEIYSVERLEEYAAYLATELKLSENPKISQPLLPRMRENGVKLLASYRALTEAIHRKDSLPPAAEWLTDNFHIVEDQLREIQEDLPPSFYKELPKIALGELSGYPRIYAIALALIAHTDSHLEPETIRRFVHAYQKISPLNIGELWALAITLRLVLVENLRRIALRIVVDHEQRNEANKFADQLFEAVEDKIKFQTLVTELPPVHRPIAQDDQAYVAQIAKRLRDQEPELWPALEYLEKYLAKKNSSTEQVIDLSHTLQATSQVTVANIITSMRLISGLNWKDFFESLSLVDRVLEKDLIYGKMDFVTRDRYRHVIEKISKRTHVSEIEIAEYAVQLSKTAQTNNPRDIKQSHVGYYLIGTGTGTLEKKFNYIARSKILHFALSHPNFVYFSLMGIFLFMSCAGPFYYATTQGALFPFLIVLGLLIIIPCSELALSLTNLILTHTIRPQNLPKLDLSLGIPQKSRTIVVIPCMLAGAQVIQELLEKIEIHYLGNADPQLFFALLTDFTDAPTESLLEDDIHLKLVLDGINNLNRKYADKDSDRFFLFHRHRQWNESEKTWMGWERKRGKIHEFNRLLRGDEKTSIAVATAAVSFLATIRYVITLDADTQLPRDSARRMIGTITHPLNQAYFDKTLGRVTEGYGVLQPRIGISLESSARSFFAKVFSGYTGIDPYTTAVSEIYQDLFQEGSYTGKGLYDVDAFEAALQNRAPENTILSHDLFEGIYSRTGLLSDVELLDDYPQSYHTFFTRQHRWTRGDWQIAAWILPFVRNTQKQWIRNQISLISKWKIFDNLRRSLVAPFTFLWFVFAWTVFPGSPLFWLAYALFIVVFPAVVPPIISTLFHYLENPKSRVSTADMKIKVNLLQALFHIVFIAHQAYIQSDAILRVMYRKFISKTQLLEWVTAAQVESQKSKSTRPFWQTSWPTEILLVGTFFLFFTTASSLIGLSFVFIFLWSCYPLVGHWISRRLIRIRRPLSIDDQLLMRQIARRTWHYFETFVGAEDNWLPPDNHQELPQALTAHRTSPTNIGLYLLSLVSARDFGYLSAAKFIHSLGLTLETLHKLEGHEGHYFNWYDTRTLEPLNPKYVSTVDSGNLAGYFLTCQQACLEIPNYFLIEIEMLEGLNDIILIIESEIRAMDGNHHELLREFSDFRQLLSPPSNNIFSNWVLLLETLNSSLLSIRKNILNSKKNETEKDFECIFEWTDCALVQIREVQDEITLLAPWTTNQFCDLGAKLGKKSALLLAQWENLVKPLDRNISLSALSESNKKGLQQVQDLIQALQSDESDSSFLFKELSDFATSLKQRKQIVGELLDKAEAAAHFMDQKFKDMRFDFLMDKNRGVFTIGYSVTDGKFDTGLYDLLASESRLASFVAIAKGEVIQEHWFRLGRQLVPIEGERALISWTASMFEYLMPLLVMRDYENTLLNETIRTVILRQISYGKEHNVPWGVSEAGYNARDLQLNYQYGPFGIPGLGLKRGLSHDLVISPYSTFLVAMVNPEAALDNAKHLIHNKILSSYGFYESIDYTSERLPENQKFAVIKSFMAHHQGMSFVAINNVINNNIIQDRFHNDTRVRATRLLLQERIPQRVIPVLPKAAEIELEGESQSAINSFIRTYTSANSATPRIQLLSNRNYSIMISTSGAGYSKCGDVAVTRWKEDATRDNWGSFIFIKDQLQKNIWSATYQPFTQQPESYQITFGEEKVEFQRRDGDISSYTQILVAPEDNVEIRHLTLTNHSDEPRIIELTSYMEPVLGPAANDLDHMAFSKLFIQTEFLASKNALLAKRRKRSSHDKENWGLHVVVSDCELASDVQYETDRAQFIGRGRNLSNAAALFEKQKLSNVCGATLDPIMSLRVQVQVPANGKSQVAFSTGLASTREQALELADRYHDIHSFERECKLAWTKSQVDMRHLNIDAETAYLYQRIAERILYSEPSLRPPAHQRALNTNVQSSLWPSGISGDLPIVVVRIGDQKDMLVIRKLLRCHEYLRLKGLVYDFIILNEHETTYFQGLQDELQQQIRSTGVQGWLNKPGGIFILRTDITPEKDIAHIQSIARVSLSADEPLKEQINRKVVDEKYAPILSFVRKDRVESVPPEPALELDYFNGIGGFSKNGREYVIVLGSGQWTPAPWINVIGNHRGFGFQVSETGAGFTWFINSQTNRLTPWSNDPVCDPLGEIIYLRDDDTGKVWTPTPLPIRSEATYIIRHGQGYSTFEHSNYGIKQTLTHFVPKNDSVKISLLTLKNQTNRKRRISITSYTELVLGSQREKTAPHLICDVDQVTNAIFARNPHDNEFAEKVTFVDINTPNRTFTCSRKEFLGRNGSYTNPAALKRDGLSKKRGTGQDPCAVFQTSIELEPGEVREISILLGQCENIQAARDLTVRYRDLKIVKEALAEVIAYWNTLINVVQVKTPEPAMNILMNSWLFYQTLSCRYWSRTAFYQSGGAYGFRDQLQDCMALVYSAPTIAREHILRASERQFQEGDVQHWWHPPTGRGVRTRMSDDLLWLPFVVSFYVNVTGDKTILTEMAPFLEAPLLKPEEEDSYTLPGISKESASVFEHCIRAINHSLSLGEHNLPLIGTGDWNDGMNRVGSLGKGESIWLGWFLYKVLADFLPYCNQPEQQFNREKYELHMKNLKMALEKDGWDGEWYRRAYFDDGTPLGSSTSEEPKIDSISQSWAVISEAADRNRAKLAMEKVDELLVKKESKLILLLTPPFDKTPMDPGYIKGYVPGVRENGGQYTHAATWVIMAYAQLGDGNKAFNLFNMLNPILHTHNESEANRYKVEPYVLAGDVYAGDPYEGRGGWSWYTGSSSWYYRVGLESLLGFQLRGDKLQIKPCIPSTWSGFELSYIYGKSNYFIQVKNTKGLSSTGSVIINVDGILVPGVEIKLIDDGQDHQVIVNLQVSESELRAPHSYSDQSKL